MKKNINLLVVLELSVQVCGGPAGAGWPLVAAKLLGCSGRALPVYHRRAIADRDSALGLQVPKPTVQIPNLTRHDGAAGGRE